MNAQSLGGQELMSRPIQSFLVKATSAKVWSGDDLSLLATIDDFVEAVTLRDGVGRTFLHAAATLGDLDAVRGLLSAGADVNAADLLGETPLIHAARAGALEAVRALLAAGAAIDAHHVDGWSALAAAVIRGHESVVTLILTHEQNVDPEILHPGMTPVRMAVQIDHAGILRRLLQAGARHDLRGFDGQTPLELARTLGRTDCERVLVESGAR